jgi:hypothetical protein
MLHRNLQIYTMLLPRNPTNTNTGSKDTNCDVRQQYKAAFSCKVNKVNLFPDENSLRQYKGHIQEGDSAFGYSQRPLRQIPQKFACGFSASCGIQFCST